MQITMCQYRVLHENTFGHIMQCNTCNKLQVGLGNIVTTVSMEGYDDMAKVINKMDSERAGEVLETQSNMKVMIKTPVDQLWIAFSKPEFEKTKELFSVASIILETEEILTKNQL